MRIRITIAKATASFVGWRKVPDHHLSVIRDQQAPSIVPEFPDAPISTTKAFNPTRCPSKDRYVGYAWRQGTPAARQQSRADRKRERNDAVGCLCPSVWLIAVNAPHVIARLFLSRTMSCKQSSAQPHGQARQCPPVFVMLRRRTVGICALFEKFREKLGIAPKTTDRRSPTTVTHR